MLVLASSSPRRKQMLTQLGYQFECVSPSIDERALPDEKADSYVARVAKQKAEHVFTQLKKIESVVLASDTIVCINGLILQKPSGFDDFKSNMLKMSGNWHQVKTSIFIKSRDEIKNLTVCTNVKFRQLNDREIEQYWKTGEPLDKAGGYAIQGIGAGFVEAIDGSYSSVVGLPLTQTIELLRHFGLDYLG